MLDPVEAAEIARGLREKYGSDALTFAQDRAERAVAVGDDLALAAWRAVINALDQVLARVAEV